MHVCVHVCVYACVCMCVCMCVFALQHNRLEEGGVLTDCRIRTFEPDDTLDFNFTSANVVNKIILHVGTWKYSKTCPNRDL